MVSSDFPRCALAGQVNAKVSEATWVHQNFLEDECACCCRCCWASLNVLHDILRWPGHLLLHANIATPLLLSKHYRILFRKYPLVWIQCFIMTMTLTCIVSLI